jgi:hypothetical protein
VYKAIVFKFRFVSSQRCISTHPVAYQRVSTETNRLAAPTQTLTFNSTKKKGRKTAPRRKNSSAEKSACNDKFQNDSRVAFEISKISSPIRPSIFFAWRAVPLKKKSAQIATMSGPSTNRRAPPAASSPPPVNKFFNFCLCFSAMLFSRSLFFFFFFFFRSPFVKKRKQKKNLTKLFSFPFFFFFFFFLFKRTMGRHAQNQHHQQSSHNQLS